MLHVQSSQSRNVEKLVYSICISYAQFRTDTNFLKSIFFFLSLLGQVHTTAGAVIGIMSSFVIIYNAAPLLKGIFKLVPKTADVCICIK